nr:hypothetical protein [Phenylobacterium sp.]
MSLRVNPAAEVRRLLPMGDCIAVMAEAMTALSGGEIDLPQRAITQLFDVSDVLILMPGAARDRPVYGAKVNSLHPGNAARGSPTVQSVVLLFDRTSGAPLAVIDGAAITALRTAAASGLATEHLARSDARSLGVLGAGWLAGRRT